MFPSLLLDKFDNLGKAEAGLLGTSSSVRNLPILLAHGTKDRIVPYAQGVELATALGAEMLSLDGAGHNNMLSAPYWNKLRAAIKRFVANGNISAKVHRSASVDYDAEPEL